MITYHTKLTRLFFLFSIVIITQICFSQVVEQWRAIYSGPGGSDHVNSMIIDSDGNLYVTGNSRNTINSYDIATVKYSSSGVQLWAERYLGAQNIGANAYSVAADRFGNAYITGIAPVSSSGPSKYTTIKYNQTGKQVWVRIFYGFYFQSGDCPYSIATDYNANIYVTGGCWSVTSGYDYTTIKYDSSGVQMWVARYDNPGQDEANKITCDDASNIYITGYSKGDTTHNDIATVKYDSSGVQQWVARYNGPGNWGDSATAMAIDYAGSVYVTGRSWGGDATGYDFVTIKYNSSGLQQWTARLTSLGIQNDFPRSIAVDNQGNVYVTGEYRDNMGITDCATVKYNSSGEQEWIKFYSYGSHDRGVALSLDNSGNVYVTAASYEGIRVHFATIKYKPSGEQEWVIRTYSANGESPAANAVDSLGNVYVSGSPPYLTIKYNQITGIIPVTNEIPNNYFLSQNFPNPFNPITKIKFDIPNTAFVKLTIYDVIGKQVYELVNDNLAAGSYSVDWNASAFASGVYFYRIEAGEYVNQMKMVLVK